MTLKKLLIIIFNVSNIANQQKEADHQVNLKRWLITTYNPQNVADYHI